MGKGGDTGAEIKNSLRGGSGGFQMVPNWNAILSVRTFNI